MLDVVGEHGYADATVAHITKAAGISRTTFYEQFRNKQDAFLTAYDEFGERFLADIAGVSATSPAEVLSAAAERLVDWGRSRPLACRAFLLEIHAVGEEGLEHRDRVMKLAEERFDAWPRGSAASIPACRHRHASSDGPWSRRRGSSPLRRSGRRATRPRRRARPWPTSGCSG